ncbi:MAG: class I tRNA ligase family protein [Caldilineaceae bacterium]
MSSQSKSNDCSYRYVTTSIPYVNGAPHIGHALEYVQADVLARYARLRGYCVRLQTGADENALKNVQAAQKGGITVEALVARNAERFRDLAVCLGLALDNFIRTSVEPAHVTAVHKFWRASAERGDIYNKAYRGLYCVNCEQFYEEEELQNGLCPIHETQPDLVEEENYFFRLSRYQDALLQHIDSDALHIVPETRKNEMLSFIRRGLRDFSISRSQARAHGWGIPVPDDPGQVIYVWFDALINYISGLDYGASGQRATLFDTFWPSGAPLHVIGKDITRFHAIYWPAMLLSAGVPLPATVLVHGFLTANGVKISKSKGNVIDPLALAAQYGTEALRYYLLRKIPATADGDFSEAELRQSYDSELANQLGNLLNRTVRMIERYHNCIIPAPHQRTPLEAALIQTGVQAVSQVEAELNDFALHKATAAIWTLVSAANKYLVDAAPWNLAKASADGDALAEERLATSLYTTAEALRLIAELLRPFLPTTAAAIARQLGIALAPQGAWLTALQWGVLAPGSRVQPAETLFPKGENNAPRAPRPGEG